MRPLSAVPIQRSRLSQRVERPNREVTFRHRNFGARLDGCTSKRRWLRRIAIATGRQAGEYDDGDYGAPHVSHPAPFGRTNLVPVHVQVNGNDAFGPLYLRWRNTGGFEFGVMTDT